MNKFKNCIYFYFYQYRYWKPTITEGPKVWKDQASVANPDPYRMFLGLTDPDLDPLVRGTNPDFSIIKKKEKKKKYLDSYCSVISL